RSTRRVAIYYLASSPALSSHFTSSLENASAIYRCCRALSVKPAEKIREPRVSRDRRQDVEDRCQSV
ncbi:MAG: hypothetical protein QW780_05535, partial [Sulfolobales archaeon]